MSLNCNLPTTHPCYSRNLHSGVEGGAVVEPMADLMAVLASMSDSRGQVLIPGFVLPLVSSDRIVLLSKSLFSFSNFELPCVLILLVSWRPLITHSFYDDVRPVPQREAELFDAIDFDIRSYCDSLGIRAATSQNARELLM